MLVENKDPIDHRGDLLKGRNKALDVARSPDRIAATSRPVPIASASAAAWASTDSIPTSATWR